MPERHKSKTEESGVLPVAVLCGIAILFAVFYEAGLSMCMSAKGLVVYGLFWTAALLPFLVRRPSIPRWAVYAVLLVSLAILYAIPWNSRKPFLRDLAKVEFGMTEAEVEAIMGHYMKGTGWPAPDFWERSSGPGQLAVASSGITFATSVSPSGELALDDSIVYRHSDKGAFNSDFGVVTFEDGRVVSTTFLPD
jgi:hypothetical protein